MKIKTRAVTANGCFYFSIPKAYIKDGNIILGGEYELDIVEIGKAIEQKTQEILTEMTKNANRTKEADFV